MIRFVGYIKGIPVLTDDKMSPRENPILLPDLRKYLEERKAMTREQIENTFTYHAPKGDQQERYVRIREKAKELAHLLNSDCPESREKSIAFTLLQQSIQMANASIAINE